MRTHTQIGTYAHVLGEVVGERIELEIETVRAKVLEVDERLRHRHHAGIILGGFDQDVAGPARITAARNIHWDDDTTEPVTVGPVFDLLADEIRIGHENLGLVRRLDLG